MHKALIHLRHAFNQVVVIDGSPAFFLTRVENMNLDKKTPRDLCRYQNRIMYDVRNQVKSRGKNTFDESGALTRVDPEEFKREIAALTLIAAKINFTPQLHAWIDDCVDEITLVMACNKTYKPLSAAWKKMDEDERIRYIEKMSVFQNVVFDRHSLKFKYPTIKIVDSLSTAWGDFQLTGNQFDPDIKPLIRIRRDVIQAPHPDHALTVLIHEKIHSVLRQMGNMHINKNIQSTHPFYKDAELMRYRMAEQSYIPSIFGPAYYADTEERLCHRTEKDFVPLYKVYARDPKTRELSVV